MKNFGFIICFLFLSSFAFQIFAQSDNVSGDIPYNKSKKYKSEFSLKIEKAEQQKKEIIEEMLLDADKLKLSKDRAWAYAKAGKLLCSLDEDRAYNLFELSIKNYLIAKQNSELIKDSPADKLYYGISERFIIIHFIGNCDSELALNYLIQTRPQTLSEDIVKYYKNPNSIDNNYRAWVQSEVFKEESLKSKTVNSNPKRADEFIKYDLENIISKNTIKFLSILYKSKLLYANKLTKEVVNKVLVTDFFTKQDKKPIFVSGQTHIHIASDLLMSLGDSGKKRFPITVSDELLSALAIKIINEAIYNKSPMVSQNSLKVIERFHPNKIKEYEQMKAERLKTYELLESSRFAKLRNSNPTNDILLSKVNTFSEEYQDKIYHLTACNMVENKNYSDAKKILLENYSNKQFPDKFISLIIYSKVLKKLGDKKYVEAEEFIDNMPDVQLKIDALSFLVRVMFNQTKENPNKQKLLTILVKANKVYESNLDSINRSEALGDITFTYVFIESNIAFTMLDTMWNDSKSKEDNGETLSKYSKIKHIDYSAISGAIIGVNLHQTWLLADNNFARTLGIINKNKSPYSRILLKGLLIEQSGNSFLNFHISKMQSYCKP